MKIFYISLQTIFYMLLNVVIIGEKKNYEATKGECCRWCKMKAKFNPKINKHKKKVEEVENEVFQRYKLILEKFENILEECKYFLVVRKEYYRVNYSPAYAEDFCSAIDKNLKPIEEATKVYFNFYNIIENGLKESINPKGIEVYINEINFWIIQVKKVIGMIFNYERFEGETN